VEIARLTSLRPIGLSLSPDLFGALCTAGLVASIAFASLFVSHARARAAFSSAVVLGGLSLGGIVLSHSFGTALALIGGVAVAALAGAPKARVLVVGALGIGGVGIAGAVAMRGAAALSHSAGERLANWEAAVRVFAAHPLTGVGYARFAPAYLEARTPDSNITRYAHSFVLQQASETGLVGLTALGAALFLLGRAIFERLRTEKDLTDVVLVGGAAALLLRCCIDYDGQIAQTATILFVLLGLLVPTREGTPRAPIFSLASLLVGLGAGAVYGQLSAREVALAPFTGLAMPFTSDDVEALATYHARDFGDPDAALVTAKLAIGSALACEDDCTQRFDEARAAVAPLLARAHGGPAAFVMAGALARHRGAQDEVLAATAGALLRDPGNREAHRLRVTTTRDPRDVEEARRWLGAAVVDAWLAPTSP
jgi:hypothetical protein